MSPKEIKLYNKEKKKELEKEKRKNWCSFRNKSAKKGKDTPKIDPESKTPVEPEIVQEERQRLHSKSKPSGKMGKELNKKTEKSSTLNE